MSSIAGQAGGDKREWGTGKRPQLACLRGTAARFQPLAAGRELRTSVVWLFQKCWEVLICNLSIQIRLKKEKNPTNGNNHT